MARNLLLTSLVLLVCVTVTSSSSPHIVFIFADDLGWNDVGWHNPDMLTPNLDKLAKTGVILNSSYVQPVCTPSRGAFMTGLYPYHIGLQHFVIMPESPGYLATNYTTLPEKLKDLGYSTHMLGKWHLGFCNWKYTPTERGFDTFYGYYNGMEDYYTKSLEGEGTAYGLDFRDNKKAIRNGEYSANLYGKKAAEIIRSQDPSKPMFLYLAFQSVHTPIQVPKRYEDLYPNIEDTTRRQYCGMVSAMDEAVGEVTRALEETGLMDNTLIVFTSDNGGPAPLAANNLPLRGSKATLWEGGTKGAAFVHSRTLLEKTGYENSQMIHVTDWFPTLLRVAGGSQLEYEIDGIDQWDTIRRNDVTKRTEFIYNINEIAQNAAIRVGDMKLIEGSPGRFSGWYPLPRVSPEEADFPPELLNTTDDARETLLYELLENHWNSVRSSEYQLFNIKDDPTEHFDIADKYPDVVDQLKARLEEYRKTLQPAFVPPSTDKSNPDHFDGVWSPGWC